MKAKKKTKKKRTAPAAFIVAGILNLRRIAANRERIPMCGAMSKASGRPCRQFAMANGRCYYHGGRTPKGKEWHRRQWPNKNAPDAFEKMQAKLRQIDRDRKAREKRIAAMTPAERAAYDKWQSTHAVGTPSERERKRDERKRNAEFRARHGINLPSPDVRSAESKDGCVRQAQARPINPDEWDIFK